MKINVRKIFGLKKEHQFEKVLLTPVPSIFRMLVKYSSARSITQGWYRSAYNTHRTSDILIILIPPGAVAICDCLHFLQALGGKLVVFLGYCGGVAKDIQIGDIFIPSKCFRGERVSMALDNTGNLTFPSNSLADHMLHHLYAQNGKIGFRIGLNYTICTLSEEEKSLLDQLKNNKIQTVDLECSCFFGISRLLNYKAFAALVVSDLPLISRIDELNCLDKSVFKSSQVVSKVCYDALSNLTGSYKRKR